MPRVFSRGRRVSSGTSHCRPCRSLSSLAAGVARRRLGILPRQGRTVEEPPGVDARDRGGPRGVDARDRCG